MGINAKKDNEFEVTHVIDISKVSGDKFINLTSTFNTITVKTLEEAKKLMNDATPSGNATFIKESNNKYSKHTYIEYVNEYVITHIITIKKNGILLSEAAIALSSKPKNNKEYTETYVKNKSSMKIHTKNKSDKRNKPHRGGKRVNRNNNRNN